MSDCGGDPNCPACADQRREREELRRREAIRILEEMVQKTRVQSVEKAFHQATHWDSARTALIEQGYEPAVALRMLNNPRFEICSSGCVHEEFGKVRRSGKVRKGTKPRERKWFLKPEVR